MIVFDDKLKTCILFLRKILQEHNYDLLVRELKIPTWYFYEPHFIFYEFSIEQRLTKIGHSNELLIKLFALKRDVSCQEVEKFLIPKNIIEELIALGFLVKENDRLRTDHYSIIPFLGTYIVASIGTARSIGAAIGRQSFVLATKMFEHSFDSFLDMGSGCGILAILAAQRAKQVVGVDILSEATEVGKVNAVLNLVEERVEFFCGDMYEPVKGRNFDAVFSNVPFLALPEKYNLISISCGENGLSFIDRMLDGLFRLRPKTTALIANGLGTEAKPLLVDLLKNKLLAKRGYQARLLVYGKGLINDEFVNAGVKLVSGACKDRGETITDEEIAQDLQEIYQKFRVNYFYGIILEISEKTAGAEIELVDISNKYTLDMWPSLRQKISFDQRKISFLDRQGVTLTINEDQKRILNNIQNKEKPTKENIVSWMKFVTQAEQLFGIKKL